MLKEFDLVKKLQGLINPYRSQSEDFLDYVLEKGTRVGLDIGSSSIKLVEVEGTPQGPVLRTVAYRDIPHAEGKSSISEEAPAAQCLAELWQTYKIKTKDVRLVISDPAVCLRYISIPKVGADELRKAIKWQAEKFVTFSIEDASVDYQVVDIDAKSDQSQMGVIIVVAEKKIIEKYLGILKVLKLAPTLIDLAPFAVAKAVVKVCALKPSQAVAVVDIGYKTTSLMVIKGSSLRMVRNIETAGEQLTRVIAECGRLDKASAEKVKREFFVPEEAQTSEAAQKIVGAVKAVLEEWTREVDRSLSYCEREALVEGVEKIILCGGGSKFKGLDKFFSKQLGIPTELADWKGKDVIEKMSAGAVLSDSLNPQFWAAFGGTL